MISCWVTGISSLRYDQFSSWDEWTEFRWSVAIETQWRVGIYWCVAPARPAGPINSHIYVYYQCCIVSGTVLSSNVYVSRTLPQREAVVCVWFVPRTLLQQEREVVVLWCVCFAPRTLLQAAAAWDSGMCVLFPGPCCNSSPVGGSVTGCWCYMAWCILLCSPRRGVRCREELFDWPSKVLTICAFIRLRLIVVNYHTTL